MTSATAVGPNHLVDTRVPGVVLLTSSFVAIVAMTLHPAESADNFDARLAVLNRVVHGTMIVLMAGCTWTLSIFASSRGWHRPLVTAGLVSWMFGAAGMTVTTLFNGFVTVDVAHRTLAAPETAETLQTILQVLGSAVDIVAVIGVAGMSTAVLLWSVDLLSARRAGRLLGVLGITVYTGTLVALLTGALTLSAYGLSADGTIVALMAWALWFVAAGALMALGKT